MKQSTNTPFIMKKTIVITGTSSGFGKLAARKFAAEGWNVVATMRSPEKETELTQLDNVLVTKLDVQDIDSIHQAIDAGIHTANPAITVYDEFMTAFMQNIGELTPPPSEPEVIVDVIYTAATDGTNQLRYIAGEDAKLVIGVKQSVDDREYMDYMTRRYKLDNQPVEA
jgi:NAD(P)-dependent dehydrogenase (short-subunit alcohol dehydrogenase family)